MFQPSTHIYMQIYTHTTVAEISWNSAKPQNEMKGKHEELATVLVPRLASTILPPLIIAIGFRIICNNYESFC